MEPGTYTLVLELSATREITFGAAGSRSLEPGFYAYTGSAFGPGGLSRVERHKRVLRSDTETRHWHIDYLLGDPAVDLVSVWTGPGLEAECEIASQVAGTDVEGIGATDCSCASHLTFHPDRTQLEAAIETAYG